MTPNNPKPPKAAQGLHGGVAFRVLRCGRLGFDNDGSWELLCLDQCACGHLPCPSPPYTYNLGLKPSWNFRLPHCKDEPTQCGQGSEGFGLWSFGSLDLARKQATLSESGSNHAQFSQALIRTCPDLSSDERSHELEAQTAGGVWGRSAPHLLRLLGDRRVEPRKPIGLKCSTTEVRSKQRRSAKTACVHPQEQEK